MKTFFLVLPALLAVGGLTFYSYAQKDNEPTAADKALDRILDGRGSGKAGRSEAPKPKKEVVRRPDAWVTAKIKTELALHKNTSAFNTGVETVDGVVTLTGEADSRAQADLAVSYAEEVEGVSAVVDRMTVRGERSVESRVDDAAVTARVKAALLKNRSTSAVSTDVRTVGGAVTLEGRARNDAERELAERLTRKVEGVKSVDNRLTID